MTALVSAEGPVHWQAHFSERRQSDRSSSAWMSLNYKLKAQIACGLCGEPLDLNLNEARRFSFAENEDEAAALDEQASDHDVLVADPKFDLMALIEDEMILSLPVLPRHRHCGDEPNGHDTAGLSDLRVDSSGPQQTQRPFADLASQMAAAGNGRGANQESQEKRYTRPRGSVGPEQ